MGSHDHIYKRLFSNPEMVRDLLKDFVPGDWVGDLDFDTLEKLNNSYITDDMRERADDIVWRVRFRQEWLYVYLLLEFQSTVDRFMAVRLLTYVGLLYQDLIKARQLPEDKQLPPVLPMVLYNGERPWGAAQQLSELVQSMPEGLRCYQPDLKYLLIDENRYTHQELERLDNLTAALIQAEMAESDARVINVIGKLVIRLDDERYTDLRSAFAALFAHRFSRVPGLGEGLTAIQDLTEMHTMLSERVKEWSHLHRQAGLKEGLEQGLERGIELGEARTLKRQLTKRFGELPADVLQQIDTATLVQLEVWLDRVLDADSLAAVLD